MLKLVFYTTSGCHLCEQAEQIFELVGFSELINQHQISFTKSDIAEDDTLEELYGVRIPVIKRLDNNLELGWPFDEQTLREFLIPS